MTIYCFSGLGADYRVFNRLDVSPHKMIHIDWVDPNKKESLKDYAIRLSKQINTAERYALLGISFGGMIAIEVAKHLRANQLILLSTIVTKDEISKRYQLIRFFRLHHFVPIGWLKKKHLLNSYFFGLKKREDIRIFHQILEDTDTTFLRWAINAILSWQNTEMVPAVRIHGKNDQIIPPKSTMKID